MERAASGGKQVWGLGVKRSPGSGMSSQDEGGEIPHMENQRRNAYTACDAELRDVKAPFLYFLMDGAPGSQRTARKLQAHLQLSTVPLLGGFMTNALSQLLSRRISRDAAC